MGIDNKNKKAQCYNRHELLEARRQLRQAGEAAEAVLWSVLKGKQINGYKFRRQFSVGPYILDFYSPAAKLCIELDGAGHFSIDGCKYDNVRSNYLLREHGIRTIRFENCDLYYNLEGVIRVIKGELKITPQSLRDSSPTTGEQ